MKAYDFTPLWRSTIGFDHVFDFLNNSRQLERQGDWPPFENGLLHVDLVRRVPEAMKPRRIAIGHGTITPAQAGTVEQIRAA